MASECAACGSSKIASMQFLEPAGFRVDWHCEAHAETDQVHYVEPQPPRVSAHTARWEPLLDPALGRVRSTSDGLVFHHSLGASGNGYRVCLDCGRAAEEDDKSLFEHTALLPPKGEAGRCSGNDKTYAITRPLALGHEVLTDVTELQPAGLENRGATWALASALREALARELGIETRELGLAIARRQSALGGATHSLFFFDQASGGAGYSPRLLDDLPKFLREAFKVLSCKMECLRGCSACVLAPDLYSQQELIDRRAALAFLKGLLASISNPEDDDVAAPGASLCARVADALSRRLAPRVRVNLYAQEVPNLSALADQPFLTLFAEAQRIGSLMRLVLPPEAIANLDEAQRFGLRDAAHRNKFELWVGAVPVARNGAQMVASLESANEKIGWFSRDSAVSQFGPCWGVGTTFPVVSAPLPTMPTIAPLRPDALERQIEPGDRVKLLRGDCDRPLHQFGAGFVQQVLQAELEASGLWKPGRLVSLSYSDRYLCSPLSMTLAMQTAVGLRDALAGGRAMLPLAIATAPIRSDPYRPAPGRLWDNWQNDTVRTKVVHALCERFRFHLKYHDGGAPHARKLVLEYDDGSRAILLFDLGFGYWRTKGRVDHNFRDDAVSQAHALSTCTASISATGESYIAIKRG